jgi:putative flippase GtrA
VSWFRSPIARARAALDVVAREVVKFGAVGALAFVVDVGVFNLLRFGLGDGGPLEAKPLSAKVISAATATMVAWLGNRLWTFRHRRRASAGHELALFVVFNVAGMAIALSCLGISHYLLDLTSPRDDNLSANGVGLVLGTLFRFWAYRTFVFRGELADDPVLGTGARSKHQTRDLAPVAEPGVKPALRGQVPPRVRDQG